MPIDSSNALGGPHAPLSAASLDRKVSVRIVPARSPFNMSNGTTHLSAHDYSLGCKAQSLGGGDGVGKIATTADPSLR